MRDLLVFAIVLAGCIATLKRPWIGVMLWTWLSIMNPHRYTYGFAYSAPLAAAAFGATVIGLLMTQERDSPFKGVPVIWFSTFVFWITLSWLVGIDPVSDYDQWKKVMKVDSMVLIALILLRTKQHIFGLMWVCAGSLAILGAKGGIFTLTTGGGGRVWGPPGSFIEDNNEFALALVMTIPLLRFLHLQLTHKWARLAMVGTMVFVAASALGSQSRGALLAIGAMTAFLWWNGKNKIQSAILIALVAVPLIMFMPESWTARMATIESYEDDRSVLGRFSAWWSAWNSAFHYPFGVGFNSARPELFAKYSPYPDFVHAAHSIYFQVLGNHGFVGLAIFLMIFVTTWRSASWLHRQKFSTPDAKWCNDLGAMCQVSLAGYAVGGAFLSLSYFDLPYYIMVLVVLTRVWVEKKAWLKEPAYRAGWKTIPGLASQTKAA